MYSPQIFEDVGTNEVEISLIYHKLLEGHIREDGVKTIKFEVPPQFTIP